MDSKIIIFSYIVTETQSWNHLPQALNHKISTSKKKTKDLHRKTNLSTKKSNRYNNKWHNFFIKNYILNQHTNSKWHLKNVLITTIMVIIIPMDMGMVILMDIIMDMGMGMVTDTTMNLLQSNKTLLNHQHLSYHRLQRLFCIKYLKVRKR